MGGVLRVEPAKPHFKDKFRREEAAELLASQKVEQHVAHRGAGEEVGGGDAQERRPLGPLKILRKDGKKVLYLAHAVHTQL
jgi:hypothetical protein